MLQGLCRAGVALGLAIASALCSAADAPEPPPVKAFFRVPTMTKPVLSPDGKRLAMLVANADGRLQLDVLEVEPPHKTKSVAGYVNGDVVMARWVNDDRLVYSVSDEQSALWDKYATALFAVNADGSDRRQLVNATWYKDQTSTMISSRQLAPNHQLLRTLRDGSADVIVQRYNFDHQWRDLIDVTPLRLNTLTGQVVAAATGYPKGARRWVLDAAGKPRMLSANVDGQTQVYWRADDAAEWTQLASFDAYRGGKGFMPWQIGADGEIYAVSKRNDPERTEALYRFDRKARWLEPEPLLGVTGFDFSGYLMFDHRRGKLLGVRYTGDALATAWLDPEMKKLQERIDTLLPGVVNLLDVAECGCSRWVLVTAYADRQPPVYLLFDRESDKLVSLGRSRPDIDARQMAERDFQRIAARDGMTFPVHVTRPNAKLHGPGPWPAVVLVHGGPFLRGGSWAWTAESQFLASRGYLVVEPEFRGSAGYGEKLFRAGFKQWGLKMQDDIADAARWAVAQKLADPQRMCIAGASYGGYATLTGLVRDPGLYRCGVAWVAVTDIQMLFDLHWSDMSDEWKGFGMPVMVGDPEKDAAQFEATSPLKQAARITQPLLLAFGGTDRRVPIEHGTRFRAAVTKTNPKVEWIEYPNEGHGWSKPEHRYDFYTRVEQFLATQLKAGQ